MDRILDRIDRPQDLHDLTDDELVQVAQEVREHIIDTVGEIGGHFGANLGTCELAVALHSLLDSPTDKVLWDVGHQAYPHKVLTGRRDQLPTIRQYEGLAPFCSIHESEHDVMGAGHASTSIGYAVGLKEGMRLRGEPDAGKVVAVIGDGAMTGGVAFEAIHQAGGAQTPIVVVLNDNGMSISPNVGALSRSFNRVRLNPRFWHAREGVEKGLTELPGVGHAFEKLGPQLKESLKAFWAPGLFWEELDWAYVGVVDGHDVHALRRALRQALEADRPVVVHIATVKGKGFAPAEEGGLEGMEAWHAAKPKSIANGAPRGEQAQGRRRPGRPAAVHEGLRRRDGPGGPPRPPRRGHHGGHELRHRAQPPPEGRARALLRRRDRRAAGGALRQRPGPRGPQAGLRDLLDLPAAGLRPDHPRRLPPGARRRLRARPRRPRRRRRADAPRRLRHRLPAPAAEPHAHGPPRRGHAPADAAHRAAARGPGGPALPPRRGDRRAAAGARGGHARAARPRRGPARGREGRDRRLRLRREAGARGGRPAGRARAVGDGRRRALRQAARRGAARAAGRRARAARHRRGGRPDGRLRLGGVGGAERDAVPAGSVSLPRILRVGLPDRYVTHGKPALLHAEVGFTGKAVAQRIEAAVGGRSLAEA